MTTLKVYRGYKYYPFSKRTEGDSGKSVHVRYSIRHPGVNPWLPRDFDWTAIHDEQGLRYYIDGLTDRNTDICSYYEEKRCIENVIFSQSPPTKTIKISPVLLLALLRGEYPLDIGCEENIVVRSFYDRYLPTHFPLALADEKLLPEYYAALNDRIRKGQPIIVDKKIKTQGKQNTPVTQVHPEMKRVDINLQAAEEQLGPVAYQSEFTYPYETFVSKRDCSDHLEVVTHILLEDHSYYYCKRYYNRQNEVVKTETSWDGEQWRTIPPEKVDAA